MNAKLLALSVAIWKQLRSKQDWLFFLGGEASKNRLSPWPILVNHAFRLRLSILSLLLSNNAVAPCCGTSWVSHYYVLGFKRHVSAHNFRFCWDIASLLGYCVKSHWWVIFHSLKPTPKSFVIKSNIFYECFVVLKNWRWSWTRCYRKIAARRQWLSRVQGWCSKSPLMCYKLL